MADYAHELTDRELTALEKKIAAAYERAKDKVQERADKFFSEFQKDAEKLYKAIEDATDATSKAAAEKAYKDFVWRKTIAGKNITDLRDKLAADMTAINQRSAALIGQKMNGVFSLNHNFAAYTLEHDLGLNLQFTLYDEFTVARLLKEDPKLLPKPKIDIALDKKWNAQKITSEITQGILTGESIPKIASRLQNVTDMNRNSAIRNARTAITGAENAGRVESYHYAESIGITLKKEWLATLDDRTRDEHRALDGQRVDIDEPFKVDGAEIMFPGDPNAEGYLVYGCRCTLVSAVEGVKDLDPVYRRDNISGELIEDLSYKEWADAKSEDAENIIDQELLDPRRIEPVNPITDEDKMNALAWDFHENGYDGRPILVVDNGDGSYQALTGSHRIEAAKEANIEIPSKVVPYSDDIAPLLEAKSDEERAEIAAQLFKDEKVDADVLALLTKEDQMNIASAAEQIADAKNKAKKWVSYKEELSESERIAEAIAEEQRKIEAAAELAARLESDDMLTYKSFMSEMESKYPDGIWGGMTGDEMEKLNALERMAYKGF